MDTDKGDRRIIYVKSKTRGFVSSEEYVRMLLSNGVRTYGSIRNELQEMGVTIGIRGLHKLLDRLEKREIIRKIPTKGYPLYFLTEKGVHDTGLMATFFKNMAINRSLNNISSIIREKEETVIKKVVEIGGLFNVYSYLVTLDFTGKPQQVDEKSQLWFSIIGTPGELVIWLEDHLATLWPENEKKPDVSITLQRTLNKKAAQKFKKILHTLYPEEMKRYDDEFQKLDEDVKNYLNLVKRQTKYSLKQLLSEL